MFIAQRTIDSWLNNIQTEQGALYEEEHKARREAERERDEERRGREEDRLLYLERQKRMIVRIFKEKYGADAQLSDNWAEGRSSDDLEALTIKVFSSVSLQEALDLFR